MRGRGLVLGADLCDLVLDQPALQRRRRAAGRLDLLEQRPGGAAELFRQVLDAAGARGRVGDLGDVGFLQQQELGVARDAAREAVGQADART